MYLKVTNFPHLNTLDKNYPAYGTTDYRQPAYQILQPNGSLITNLEYKSFTVNKNKPKLEGLPSTYCENDNEASTLTIHLHDELIGLDVDLNYTIFSEYPVIARSVRFINNGKLDLHLLRALSFSLDLPDKNYEFIHFDGAWARERHICASKLQCGVQSVGSVRGYSSHNHNPFIMLRRPGRDESHGEVIGFSFIYSGNF